MGTVSKIVQRCHLQRTAQPKANAAWQQNVMGDTNITAAPFAFANKNHTG
jgi:hypothetical protein